MSALSDYIDDWIRDRIRRWSDFDHEAAAASVTEHERVLLNRPRTFEDWRTPILEAHAELMNSALASFNTFEVWDGGVFCLDCEDTPGCELMFQLIDRPACAYKCPVCNGKKIVDDLALRMSEPERD